MSSTWKGAISFGLVNIPIAVVSGHTGRKVAFKKLRKESEAASRLMSRCGHIHLSA